MRLTLGRAMTLFTLTLILLVSGVFYWRWTKSKDEADVRATSERTLAVDRAVKEAGAFLEQGDAMLKKLADEFAAGRCEGVSGAESCLLSALARSSDFSEATYITKGDGKSWQLSVFRAGDGRMCTRQISMADKTSRTECREAYQLLAACKPEGLPQEVRDEDDPASRYGFTTPFEEVPGKVIRSDISARP